MVTNKITTLLVTSLLAGSGIAHAGVVVGGTRVVYDGANKESSISVENPDNTPYLIQSWVENEAGQNDKNSFIVTPPLFRLDTKSKNTLRVMRISPSLPEDRESLYWLNIKSIPATRALHNENTLQLAVKTRIKLIYRPAALKDSNPDKASDQLTWSRQGSQLTIKNPTPYFINFNSISVGGKKLTNVTYASPLTTTSMTLPASVQGTQIEWKVISDYGAISGVHRTSL